jgi:hypothetical protein
MRQCTEAGLNLVDHEQNAVRPAGSKRVDKGRRRDDESTLAEHSSITRRDLLERRAF